MLSDGKHLYWDKYHMLYATNKDFHDYVERLRRPGKNDAGKSLAQILGMKTVQNIGDYFDSRPTGENASPFSPVFSDDFYSCEDKSC